LLIIKDPIIKAKIDWPVCRWSGRMADSISREFFWNTTVSSAPLAAVHDDWAYPRTTA